MLLKKAFPLVVLATSLFASCSIAAPGPNDTNRAVHLSDSFNLICNGVSVLDGEKHQSFSQTFRIDLGKKLFCADDCADTHSITTIDNNSIEYHCDSQNKSMPCWHDGMLLLETDSEREDWSIDLSNLKYLDSDHSSGGDIVSIPHSVNRTGVCSIGPFTGFAGQLLYPEEYSAAEASDEAAQFPEAFSRNTLLRVIVRPKFSAPHAVWISKNGQRFEISSTEERCRREIDGTLAMRIANVWRTTLRLVDPVSAPNRGNRPVYHFSLSSDSSASPGWAKEPEYLGASRADSLIELTHLLVTYCETGRAQTLDAKMNWIESWGK